MSSSVWINALSPVLHVGQGHACLAVAGTCHFFQQSAWSPEGIFLPPSLLNQRPSESLLSAKVQKMALWRHRVAARCQRHVWNSPLPCDWVPEIWSSSAKPMGVFDSNWDFAKVNLTRQRWYCQKWRLCSYRKVCHWNIQMDLKRGFCLGKFNTFWLSLFPQESALTNVVV